MAGKLASVRAHRSLVAAKYPKMAVQLRPVPICKPVGRGKISFSHSMTVLDGTRESPGSATGFGGRGGGGACEIMTKTVSDGCVYDRWTQRGGGGATVTFDRASKGRGVLHTTQPERCPRVSGRGRYTVHARCDPGPILLWRV